MNAFFRRYFALATKEVQQLRRNRGLLVQLLLPPTIVLMIFGFALNPKVRNLRLGIVDESLRILLYISGLYDLPYITPIVFSLS